MIFPFERWYVKSNPDNIILPDITKSNYITEKWLFRHNTSFSKDQSPTTNEEIATMCRVLYREATEGKYNKNSMYKCKSQSGPLWWFRLMKIFIQDPGVLPIGLTVRLGTGLLLCSVELKLHVVVEIDFS